MSFRQIVFYLLVAFSGLPVLRWYISRIGDGSDEPMGLLALGSALVLIAFRRRELQSTSLTCWVGAGSVLGSVLAAPVIPAMIQAALFILGTGLIAGLRKHHLGIFGLLFLSLPVIASLQFYFGYPLRIVAATIASAGLKLFNVDVVQTGTAINWQGQSIMVDPPCAGLNMLWTITLICLSLAAWNRLGIGRTAVMALVSVLAAIIANSLRVFLLFFKESGILNLPDWTHPGIGLVVFAPLVWLVLKFIKFRGTAPQFEPRQWVPSPALLLAMSLGPIFMMTELARTEEVITSSAPVVWPKKWKGEWLEPMPLSRAEREFAKNFPGKIGVFQAGHRTIILKQIEKPTRKLHSIVDCLKASGNQVTRIGPGKYVATGVTGSQYIEETIFKDCLGNETKWTDVSEWFWNTSTARKAGCWIALVEIENRVP